MPDPLPKLARIYFVGNPHGLDTDETFAQVSSRLDNAAWQPDGGVSQGFPRTFDTEVNGRPVTVNALLVTHVAEYERTPF